MKGVMRFSKKGKLSLRYIGPFEILERIGAVAYHLALSLVSCVNALKVYTRSFACSLGPRCSIRFKNEL